MHAVIPSNFDGVVCIERRLLSMDALGRAMLRQDLNADDDNPSDSSSSSESRYSSSAASAFDDFTDDYGSVSDSKGTVEELDEKVPDVADGDIVDPDEPEVRCLTCFERLKAASWTRHKRCGKHVALEETPGPWQMDQALPKVAQLPRLAMPDDTEKTPFQSLEAVRLVSRVPEKLIDLPANLYVLSLNWEGNG